MVVLCSKSKVKQKKTKQHHLALHTGELVQITGEKLKKKIIDLGAMH